MSDQTLCIECGSAASLVTGRDVYPHRPDLHAKMLYRCGCGAYVGCHPNTTTPLGSPCGPETRKARMAAHAAFDPLWQTRGFDLPRKRRRGWAYGWLSDHLGIDREVCHIGMMDADTARRVVEACREMTPQLLVEHHEAWKATASPDLELDGATQINPPEQGTDHAPR